MTAEFIILCALLAPLLLLSIAEFWKAAHDKGFRKGSLAMHEFLRGIDEAEDDAARGIPLPLLEASRRPARTPLSDLYVNESGVVIRIPLACDGGVISTTVCLN